jgi:hypothetical protein
MSTKTTSKLVVPASAASGSSWTHREIQIPSAENSNSKRDLDRRLDQALEHTFPASDPISIMI